MTTVHEPTKPMPSTFLVMSFSVLVLNESAIVVGLYKVISVRPVIDLAALFAVSLLANFSD